jgi:uncharacterized protein
VRTAGRRALVTGASSGIGAAIAERLAADGCALTLVGRDERRLAAVAARTGGTPVVADLATRVGVDAVITAGEGMELLVHSAGIGAAGPVAEMPEALVDELVAVNLTAPLQLTRALLPGLTHVVFVASIAAIGVADEAVYSATKAGLRGFADALRIESSVGVTTVLPGAVDTAYYELRGRPYHRRFPRPVTAGQVADATLAAVRRNRAEVVVPRWLTLGARVHGAAPATFARLSRRFDPHRPS